MLKFTDEEKAEFAGRDPQLLLQAFDEMWARMVADPTQFRPNANKECHFPSYDAPNRMSATEIIQRRARCIEVIREKTEAQPKREVTTNDRTSRFKK